jgi:dTDP-4-dehydrorhamnose reductase
MAKILDRHPNLSGLYHVASTPITKLDLLTVMNAAFRAGITIDPVDDVALDRSLDGSRFREATGIEAPSWHEMLDDLAGDPTPYDEWRQARVS